VATAPLGGSALVLVALVVAGPAVRAELAAPVGIRISKASAECIAASEPIPNWKQRPPSGCSVAWELLGEDGKRLLYGGRYAWQSQESEWSVREGYKVITEVLFEGQKASASVIPIWHEREDETYAFLRSVSLARVGSRSIVKVSTCLNGTGGCWSALYIWRPHQLLEVGTDIRSQIEQQLPRGYTLLKSPEIEVESLTVSGGAWLLQEGNCCPSARLKCALRFDGDRVRVFDCRVTPDVQGVP
jgi:hypothetical protein